MQQTAPAAFDHARPVNAMPRGLDATPWLGHAYDLLNAGTGLSKDPEARLLKWIDRIDRRLPVISLPWCGFFVAHCLAEVLEDFTPPRHYFRARHWQTWGEPARPQLGAIMHIWYMKPNSPFGHVGFYVGEDSDCYHLLGGNQHDTIMIMRFSKLRCDAVRWPAGVPQPGITRVMPGRDVPTYQGW